MTRVRYIPACSVTDFRPPQSSLADADTDLELFQTILLGIAQATRMDALLPTIVSGLVDRADYALARTWLLDAETTAADGKKPERFLRLSASAGSSRTDGRLWNGIEGEFARIRMGSIKIGYIAQSGEPLHLDEHEIAHSRWTAHPDWVAGDQGLCRTPAYLSRHSPGSPRSVQQEIRLAKAN